MMHSSRNNDSLGIAFDLLVIRCQVVGFPHPSGSV